MLEKEGRGVLNPNCVDYMGRNALHLAIDSESVEAIEILMEKYPPDVTPLMLAAHKNDHEMIQMFLARGSAIEKPHAIYCQCQDCFVKQQCDSLKRSRSRLNAYKALSSPAYIALSSLDPITETFELRQEMMQIAEVEKEFQ
ncbi:hypothetical protein LSH36_36g02035, partial [Paralvinella palmiformis]